MTNNYYQKSKEKLQKDVRERYTQKKPQKNPPKKWKRSHNKNLFEEQKKKLAEYRSII